jgi:hypothetical protein
MPLSPIAWYSGTAKSDLHTFPAQDLDILVISPLPHARNDTPPLRAQVRHPSPGAALDLMDPEPLPEDDPLWDAKNVIITPHISGLAMRYGGREGV